MTLILQIHFQCRFITGLVNKSVKLFQDKAKSSNMENKVPELVTIGA